MRRQGKQLAVACDKAAALQREQDAPRGRPRQLGGPRDVAQRHRAGRFAERLQQAQAAVETLDEIGGALLAAFTLQLRHWPFCLSAFFARGGRR